MSLKKAIQKAVDSAFRAVGDLKRPATLRSSETVTYNFATGEYVHSTPVDTEVEVLIPQLSVSEAYRSSNPVEVLVRGPDLDSSDYNLLIIDNKTFRIETLVKHMEFIYVLTVRGVDV